MVRDHHLLPEGTFLGYFENKEDAIKARIEGEKYTSTELYPILGPLSQEGGMAKIAWPSAGKERAQ